MQQDYDLWHANSAMKAELEGIKPLDADAATAALKGEATMASPDPIHMTIARHRTAIFTNSASENASRFREQLSLSTGRAEWSANSGAGSDEELGAQDPRGPSSSCPTS